MEYRNKEIWPELSFEEGKETYRTIHLWTQIIGKIKLAKMPWINHSWHVALMVTPVGLTTGDLPSDDKHFQIDIDFLNHQLEIITSQDEVRKFNLLSLSVGAFYRNIFASLKELGIKVKINPIPSEMENPAPLDKDERNSYAPEIATALHGALLKSNEVFTQFRAGFIGKCSPVHFFWGSFDLCPQAPQFRLSASSVTHTPPQSEESPPQVVVAVHPESEATRAAIQRTFVRRPTEPPRCPLAGAGGLDRERPTLYLVRSSNKALSPGCDRGASVGPEVPSSAAARTASGGKK